MNWLALICAGLFEMLGVVMMNKVNAKKSVKNIALLLIGFGMSFACLSFAMQTLEMSIAYAIWTGIGATGGAVLGMVLYGEPKTMLRIFFITLIIGSVVGLKLAA
ncbi:MULTISPECIES: multidrug efflux SMR transporter [unclassified Paenibacillus]|uniref:DMT family transporter n=1 Tax=unclassified Paenibacillus TaxID=185978 RepID=UPI00104CB02A|nr:MULTISPECIES: multidrug efflux SMR transporter [unclassified Paenibacillus]NIK71106.1 paired small multidrug resistance pump [Paenibacillus sp. BK720]TCM97173.1 paired small multidrug resistance pump [Paenibacillus sp. BK033]